jgi:hypothetical protein
MGFRKPVSGTIEFEGQTILGCSLSDRAAWHRLRAEESGCPVT